MPAYALHGVGRFYIVRCADDRSSSTRRRAEVSNKVNKLGRTPTNRTAPTGRSRLGYARWSGTSPDEAEGFEMAERLWSGGQPDPDDIG